MKKAFLFLIALIPLMNAWGNEIGLDVHILQPMIHAIPGTPATIQVEIINRSSHHHVLVSHLALPPLWEVLPSNNLLLHIHPGQCAIQTLLIKPPDHIEAGNYSMAYEVWEQNNASILGRDTFMTVIGEMPNQAQISIEMKVPPILEANPGELIYVSALVKNELNEPWDGPISLSLPPRWTSFPPSPQEIHIDLNDSKAIIYAIQVPKEALAGEHPLTLYPSEFPRAAKSVNALIRSKVDVVGSIEGIKEVFNLNQDVSFFLRYENKGNITLNVRLEITSDPKCKILFNSECFEIPPHETCEIPIQICPDMALQSYNQFILVKLVDANTCEQLYQNPTTLKFTVPGQSTDDAYTYVPGIFRTMALRDRYKNVFAAEIAGGGIIDEEKQRSMDFIFRLPTNSRHILYNVDQRLYLGIQDPSLTLNLGDTVYELSPLTQSFRYGRGAGIDKRWNEHLETGVHYTQNTLSSNPNPHELGSYIQYNLSDTAYVAWNYLHKVEQDIPTSNLVTLEAGIEFPENITTELELGMNFLKNKGKGDTHAYRIATFGKLFKESWFNFEKSYAGPQFYGYYNHLHLMTGCLDLAVSNPIRLNLNASHLSQDFYPKIDQQADAIIPRQREYGANLTYEINNYCSFGLNGMLLKAKDANHYSQYNFFQKWGGFSLFFNRAGYQMNTMISFGEQKDYLTHKSTHWLQRYYSYISKDFFQNLRGFIFYDGGNTNYYDAKPWRNGFGGAISYQFAPTGTFDLYFQRLFHTEDMLDMTQFSCTMRYVFKNLHQVEASVQSYRYLQNHYPNDTLALISYSIPLSIPIGRNKNIGALVGSVYNTWDCSPVAGALIGCDSTSVTTEANGRFSFSSLPKGIKTTEVALLPDDLIASSPEKICVNVRGGSKTEMFIPVVPACLIEGKIIRYSYQDIFTLVNSNSSLDLIQAEGLEGIQVAVALDGDKEIYLCRTNSKGNFSFPKLRPGVWHIKVYDEELPNLYALDFNDILIDLLPGKNQTVEFKVKPIAPLFYKLSN